MDMFLLHLSIELNGYDKNKQYVCLPSKPFQCEAGSGLILPLAAAVWKTSDFVVFS